MSTTTLLWPDYSAAQYAAIAQTLSSAIAVAQHGERRCREGARTDPLGIMARDAEYYRHAARYCRWLLSQMELRREQAVRRERKRGNTNRPAS